MNTPAQPCGTRAAYRRHLRRGERACMACLAAERERYPAMGRALRPETREFRNGLPPFRPYIYRGTGSDIYEETA